MVKGEEQCEKETVFKLESEALDVHESSRDVSKSFKSESFAVLAMCWVRSMQIPFDRKVGRLMEFSSG